VSGRAVLVIATLAALPGCAMLQIQSAAPGATTHAAHGGAGGSSAAGATAGAESRSRVAVGNTSSGGSIVASGEQAAVVDSGPSAEAISVLATIPEPLPPGDRVPAPPEAAAKAGATAPGSSAAGAKVGAAPGASGAGAASSVSQSATAAGAAAAAAAAALVVGGAHPDSTAFDTTASAAADTVPVPSPTEPLGERPEKFVRALTDTTPAVPPAAPPPPAPTKVEPDSCWRIQVGAPTDKHEADLKREAAESVLLVPFVIEHEKSRYKVRNRDCLGREAADKLRRRALESGFEGAFPVLETRK
jgi:hypothetical protein